MTCVVGWERGKHVVLAGDSAVRYDNGYLVISQEPKVWTSGKLVWGFAGHWSAYGRIRYLEVDDTGIGRPARYAHTVLTPAIQRVAPKRAIWCVLVGVGGHLYEIDSDGSCIRAASGIAAIGTGGQYALCALSALTGTAELTTEKIVRRSVQLVARLRPGDVAEPVHVATNEYVVRT